MYCLVPEKPLRLVYETFYLTIGDTFYEFIKSWQFRYFALDYKVYTVLLKSVGGEMASTGIKKLRLHTELLPARKNGGNVNIIADDYELALAA